MALKNAALTKIGSTILNSGPDTASQTSGHSQMTLVKNAVALADPGARNLNDSTWPARYAAYIQSVQVQQKFSQDWE